MMEDRVLIKENESGMLSISVLNVNKHYHHIARSYH